GRRSGPLDPEPRASRRVGAPAGDLGDGGEIRVEVEQLAARANRRELGGKPGRLPLVELASPAPVERREERQPGSPPGREDPRERLRREDVLAVDRSPPRPPKRTNRNCPLVRAHPATRLAVAMRGYGYNSRRDDPAKRRRGAREAGGAPARRGRRVPAHAPRARDDERRGRGGARGGAPLGRQGDAREGAGGVRPRRPRGRPEGG